MLFRHQPLGALAISQLTHAWISGQLLRAWDANLPETLLLAAEQHDIGWMDWETEPTFNTQTGRPHLFREIGASTHAPMWTRGVQRALGAWGTHVALLISRHGGIIYRRYTDRHRVSAADAAAADSYLKAQAPIESEWSRALGLQAAELERQTALLALSDTLSLALCGELKTPLELEAHGRDGNAVAIKVAERTPHAFDFVVAPWPFRTSELLVEGEARLLPSAGRFPDENAMKTWLALPERATFRARLSPA
jgi:hypothetical protein